MCHGHCVTCPLTLSQSQHLTSSAQKKSPIRLQNLEGQPYGCEKIRAFGSCTLLLPLDIAAPTLLLGKMVHTFIAAKAIPLFILASGMSKIMEHRLRESRGMLGLPRGTAVTF